MHRFRSTMELGDKALAQLCEADLLWRPGPESNSIAVIIQHLHGNMLSRWTDLLSSDGEKPWRERDAEFTEPAEADRARLMELWEEGWACLLKAVDGLVAEDLALDVVVRGQSLSVLDAINRQLAHYAYHVGQIVYVARARKGETWNTLSIARGASRQYAPRQRD
ncbi:MAG: DUF1572 family protein [Candidatus Hydrogenedentes bacterium]|nr:DUF1572 family protein [Candidatus Hydrogenedentota bacterium]